MRQERRFGSITAVVPALGIDPPGVLVCQKLRQEKHRPADGLLDGAAA